MVRRGVPLSNIDTDPGAAILTAGLITKLVSPPIARTLLSRAQAESRERSM